MVKKSKADPSLQAEIHQYHIVGRAAPTAKKPHVKVYRMRLFAKNPVIAKAKFWYFMKKINKAKKSGGQILAVDEIHEEDPSTIKNFAIYLRYDSRTATHNMYKEYRDTTQNGAVSQMYAEMAGRHRALSSNIQIIRIEAIPDDKCIRENITQFHADDLRFPLIRRLPMPEKKYRTTFTAKRPTTFLR
ncbi:unnamed protein product [Vitrella brassicaformis CCMP3155]|uniref:60S ribosomal protein L18a n=1 Tax=Vitrella brassicaformis (strain CCMP3155) TaxID=1169540 RepID=A0A0G4EA54_VITBC|nr:unnamed protein product [Vitrella brassicaformis CCMP3155]|eukprot:CEL92102.1 unnamed protein product [Vitrella brassicaformis CCMP3155]